MSDSRLSFILLAGTIALCSGCAGQYPTELSAHDCFQDFGLMVFDSHGDVSCMSEAQYALSRSDNPALISDAQP